MTYILTSTSIDRTSHLLGGKAAALAALMQQDFPIPEWIVLSPAAFAVSLTERSLSSPSGMVQAELPSHPLPSQLQESVRLELMAALAILCPHGEAVAVRSSALDEDGTAHSFAGQLESFLNVSPEDVPTRILDVWRSGFSDRLLAYRQEHCLSPLPQPPAVLIQRMVKADAAGVAFSANPITGQRGIAVVSAVRGLGDSLVSGEKDADTYQVDRQGEVVHRQVCSDSPGLTDAQIQAIATLARRAETCFGSPQDIEWAIEAGQLYLLQSRPITTLNQMADPDGELNIWDNSNIAESYGGVTTPLTFSFARGAYEAVYRQFCRMMGVPETAIAQHDTTFRRMLGLVRGRIYYNLLNWYRVLALLPGFTVNRRFMEQMMGVKEELPADVLTTLAQANFRDRLRDGLRLVSTLAGLLKNYATLPAQITRFYQRLDRALSLPITDLEAMRPDQLAAYYTQLEQQLLTRWDAPLVNDFFAMIFYGVLRKLTVKWCGDRDGTLQNDLVSGEGGMISAEPAHRVRRMAAIAARNPDFAELLCTGSRPQILRQLETVPEFQTEYQEYLQKFGDRCLEELKLESTTLHDDPLLLLRSVGQLAVQPPRLPQPPTPQPQISVRQQAEAQVQQHLKRHPLRRYCLGWVLNNARARVRDRENLRFERTRVFGRVRRIFVELGRRLHAQALLNHPRDIFYLEVSEILGFIDGTATSTDLKGLVSLRQAEFERYQTLPSPGDRFQTYGMVHPFTPPVPAVSQVGEAIAEHRGTGCCPGIVRAPVQVIVNPQTAVLRPGSILVAERTDPGWIMLFPAAAGLLVERGSLLSHSAIVAREMGIPAIVSIPGVTQALKEGDWVEMDGSTGIVRRIMPPSDASLA